MCKNLQNKILISLLAAGSLGICSFTNPAAAAAVTVDNNLVTSHNNEAIATDADFNGYDYLKAHSDNEITVSNTNLNNFTGVGIGEVFNGQYTPFQNNRIVLTNSDIKGKVTGVSVAAYYPSVQNVNLKIINTNVADGITVADISSYSEPIKADNIKLSLEGNSEISGDVVLVYRGTWAHYDLQTQNNEIILKDAVNVENADLYAFASTDNTYGQNPPGTITSDDATLTLDGWSGKIGSLHDFNIINFDNIDFSNNNILDITGTAENMENVQININSISAGDYAEGTTNFTISWDSDLGNNVTIDESLTAGKFDTSKYYITNRKSAEDGIYITKFTKAEVTDNNPNDNSIEISATVAKSILAGKFIDENGIHYNSNQTADTASLTIGDGFTTEVGTVAGVYAVNKSDDIAQDATSGMVNINGSIDWNGNVYAGYSESGAVNNNTINAAAGTKAPNINLSGYNTSGTGNTLNIAGNGSVFNSIEKFDTINFDGVNFNSDAALTVTSADVSGAIININSLAGGQTFNVGDTQTLLSSANVFTGSGLANDIVTAGLVQDVEFSAAQSEDNKSIDLRVEKVSTNKQIDLVAENRAVAAAFVNQGTDLISDSLDTLSRDGNHGVKTFAAVHGNRSKYDVNSDLKINGWSTIVGIGNAAEFADGDEFSWGVFYENGSGNYRTYNEFNNEFFRGDGSLVYNGGGIAARYKNASGVYTEGSLRAGMLKSEMDNALRDGSGNYYGYDSESGYYGAHIGVGKIISLSDSSDLDVYGKFFHTYTEGDSFTVDKDKFEFDSITSDRLRIGARVTTNKANAFSTYYGLAYEYEFNGDADMRAQNLKAPTQSLQGSSYMAEVGFNYQPTPDSPWSFDLNMRGYAGEREGASFNVQATYTF